MVRRLSEGADPAEFSYEELHAARELIDSELIARRLPLVLDELNGRALLDELEARTGSRSVASRLVDFMDEWADEAILSQRGEPTVAEMVRATGLSKATVDRRLREYRDALGTEQTPTAQVKNLRKSWHGPLKRIPVRTRFPEARDA